jgi:hypothetical protein
MGTGAANDALAQGPPKRLPAPPEWLAGLKEFPGAGVTAKRPGPVTSLNAALYPTGDPVLDRVHGIAAAMQPIPTKKQIKDILAQGLGSVFGISDAWDSNTQAINAVGKALSNPKEVLSTAKDVLSTPYGQGIGLGTLIPFFHGKVPTGVKEGHLIHPIPKPVRGWTRSILQSDFPDWDTRRTLTDEKLRTLLSTIREKHPLRMAGRAPIEATLGDVLQNPIVKDVFKEQLNLPLDIRFTPTISGPSGSAQGIKSQVNLGHSGRITLAEYLGDRRPTIRVNKEIPRRTPPQKGKRTLSSTLVPTTPLNPTSVAIHEMAHFRWPDLDYDDTIPWAKRPNEVTAERAARIYSPLENLHNEFIPFGMTAQEYYNYITKNNARNTLLWR